MSASENGGSVIPFEPIALPAPSLDGGGSLADAQRVWRKRCALAEANRLSALIVIVIVTTSGGAAGAELPKPADVPGAQSCTTANRDLCTTEAFRCNRDCTLLETCTRACCLKLTDYLALKGCQFDYPSCAR